MIKYALQWLLRYKSRQHALLLSLIMPEVVAQKEPRLLKKRHN